MKQRFGSTPIWLAMVVIGLTSLMPGTARNAPAPQAVTCAQVYIVQVDDWLSDIADKLLGDALAYSAIMAATNQKHEEDASFAHIIDPNLIEPGWKLCVPDGVEGGKLLAQAAPLPQPKITTPVAISGPYTLNDFVAGFNFSPLVNRNWIYDSPEKAVKYELLPEHEARQKKYGFRANYLWNEQFMDRYYGKLKIFQARPETLYVFPGPDGSIFPRYRFPPHVTLPTGLTTNRFGWRGPELTLNKPRRTIRIACIGASTTVGGHSLPYSYPELLQYWLNLWSEANGYRVKFEVINAGREAISSPDIAAVVRYELLPMDLDYVIYYEGSNQFDPRSMVSFPPDVTYGKPPPGLVPSTAGVEPSDKTLLDSLTEYSALAARTRSMVENMIMSGQEPPKPEQSFNLPGGLDEMRPQRKDLGGALALNRILNDLDQIKRELDAADVKLFLATFDWFVYEGLVLDLSRHRYIYGYLNGKYWPISYANMRRMADLQNRVFVRWAADNRVPVIDVARYMPRQPDLYTDAIHNTPLGVRVRAWINFQSIVPILQRDIEAKSEPDLWPRRPPLRAHPFLQSDHYIKDFQSELPGSSK